MDTKSFEGEAKIQILFPCSMPGYRASFPASNSDSAYSVPAPPSHPAQLQRPGHRGHGKPAQGQESAQFSLLYR